MFDTLGFLGLHHDSPPYLLYLLEKLVDGISEESTKHPTLRSITTTLLEVTIGINQSLNMESATVCDRNFKSKNITVHRNATIVTQTRPKLVHSAEQWKALEIIAIVEGICPIVQ